MRQLLYAFTLLLSISVISCSSGPDTTFYDVSVTVTPEGAGTISPAADSSYEEGQSKCYISLGQVSGF